MKLLAIVFPKPGSKDKIVKCTLRQQLGNFYYDEVVFLNRGGKMKNIFVTLTLMPTIT